MSGGVCPRQGKQVHLTKGKAAKCLQGLKRRGGYEGTIFRCGTCNGWHIGRVLRGVPGSLKQRRLQKIQKRHGD